jgi:hypothetical protein
MLDLGPGNYHSVSQALDLDQVILRDHLEGFARDYTNPTLHWLDEQCTNLLVRTEYIFNSDLQYRYRNLDLRFDLDAWLHGNQVGSFVNYTSKLEWAPEQFLSCFLGSPHVGRKLLAAILNRNGWFGANCSKPFAVDACTVDGHIQEIAGSRERLYLKFFLNNDSQQFLSTVQDPFGYNNHSLDWAADAHNNHTAVMHVMGPAIHSSFVNLISETLPTSHYPFVTERLFYSVVSRGLFVAYAQPGWHQHIADYFGFKLFDIFDYSFDKILDPIERLVGLVGMLSMFSKLSKWDWHDLQCMEQDTREYNWQHFVSGDYLKFLRNHASTI